MSESAFRRAVRDSVLNERELSCRQVIAVEPRYIEDPLHLYVDEAPYFSALLSHHSRWVPKGAEDFYFPLVDDLSVGNPIVRRVCEWNDYNLAPLLNNSAVSTGSPSKTFGRFLTSYSTKKSYSQTLMQGNFFKAFEESYCGNPPEWFQELLQQRESAIGADLRFLRSRERAYSLISDHYQGFRRRALVIWGEEDRNHAQQLCEAIARVLDPEERKPFSTYVDSVNSFTAWRKSDPRELFPPSFTELGELSLGVNRQRGMILDDILLHRRLREIDRKLVPLFEELEINAVLEGI